MVDTTLECDEQFPSRRAVIVVTVLALYLLGFLILIGLGYYGLQTFHPSTVPAEDSAPGLGDIHLYVEAMLFAGVGGCLYCLRGLYVSFCVRKQWSNHWILWYATRPFVSLICGLICYVFVKSGVLVFEAKQEDNASNFALYAISFISGYNVNNFLKKIEAVSKVVFGIDQTNLVGDAKGSKEDSSAKTNPATVASAAAVATNGSAVGSTEDADNKPTDQNG